MSLREVFRERRLVLLLAAVMAFYIVAGVLFRLPEGGETQPGKQESSPTMAELGLDDPKVEHEEIWLPSLPDEWRSQLLIGH